MDDDSDSCFKPHNLEGLFGQEHLLGKNKPLYEFYYADKLPPSLILYGPPGCGKTSYAKMLSEKHNTHFVHINATSSSSARLRDALKIKPLLLVIDEIHRFDKRQQDILLPFLEGEGVVMVGTSTYNPYFKLTKALRSRCFVYEFKPLDSLSLKKIAKKGVDCLGLEVDDDFLDRIVMYASKDARRLVNIVKMVADFHITKDNLNDFFNVDVGFDNETQRYDLISAFIKSLRGSSVDAALYYLARLIKANEDPEFIARRMCIFASEDVGLADSNAINIASSTLNIVKDIGLPECYINLAHCCVYLAKTKKSNSSYAAVKKALKDVENGVILDVPPHLKSHPTKPYLYPHNYKNSRVEQEYTTKKVKYFEKRENDTL